MAHRIESVTPGSVAARCGIKPGDALILIDGETVIDQIDYQFLTAKEQLTLAILTEQGEEEIELEKEEDESLGLSFGASLMAETKTCANHCVFCFVDQMPKGLRDTLYVKDDDWRLSLMMGNYITLTNLSGKEFDRLIARRASPLYLSIHATDGALRAQMMGNSRASDILSKLKRLSAEGLSFHCQIVLCPGLNDGEALDETLETLSGFFPAARSAALVPVGLTRYREGLFELAPYTKETAGALLAKAHQWQKRLLKKLGTRFVFAADELYTLSGTPLPPDEAYEDYPQIENGVGLLRSFETEFNAAFRFLNEMEIRPRLVLIATGTSAAPFLRELIQKHPIPGVTVKIHTVPNKFFGPSVTVAGLLTGGDLIDAISGQQADEILISKAMLRHEGDMFLDGVSLDTLTRTLGIPVRAVPCDGEEFLSALTGSQQPEE